jgi:hypothetical protein
MAGAELDGQELKVILCRMAPGMSLVVPDEWIDQAIPGTRLDRARLVDKIALEYSCCCHQEIGFHRFERLEYPRLG